MATKRASGTRSEVVRCPNCGEDYSITYKRCPFCDERSRVAVEDYMIPEDDAQEEGEGPRRPTGKRLAGSKRRGGGYGGDWSALRVAGTICSLGLIVAAVWIVFSVVAPMVDRGSLSSPPPATPPASAVPSPGQSVQPEVSATPGLDEAVTPEVTPTVPPAVTPAPVVTTKPVQSPAVGGGTLKLNRDDFSLPAPGSAFTMKAEGATGAVTWKVENPGVATIDANGKVTAVGKGTTNIVATAADGSTGTCIVRVQSGTPAAAASPAPATSAAPVTSTAPSAGALALNREDFSFSAAGQSFTMKVSGSSGTPSWSIDKSGVATIDANGKVTAVSPGKATITCQVDGKTLTCIVRCQF